MPTKAISKAAERAMKVWTARVQSEHVKEIRTREKISLSQKGPYIVISREAGLQTTQIAHDVAAQLDWDALDHELLDELAERYDAPVQLMEVMDEQPAHWLADMLNQGVAHREWSSQAFVHRAAKIIQLAGHNGNCVIVGRGAQYILPHENGLFVRLIGTARYRAGNIAKREDISIDNATTRIAEIDRQREGFVRQFFHHDVTDLHQYDLVVNVEKVGPDNTAKLIAAAYKSQA